MSDFELPVSFPLDSDGFLRRACPTCDREFKWRPSESTDESAPASPADYFCPYCGASAAPDQWFTAEQVAYIEDEVMENVITPSLDGLAQSIEDIDRTSGGLIKLELNTPVRDYAPMIFEPDDMRRVEFACHPSEPLKVLETWIGDVYCLVCGEATDASAH